MTPPKLPEGAVSQNPDEMAAGGALPDEFHGTITKARMTAWDYGPESDFDDLLLFGRLWIEPDDGTEFEEGIVLEEDGGVTQYYSAGHSCDFFVPANEDGIVDLESDEEADWEGICAIPAPGSSKTQMSSSSNWAFFISTLRQAAADAGVDVDISPDVRCFEGLHGFWKRIPQPERKRLKGRKKSDRSNDLLCLVELTEALKGKSKRKTRSKKAASKKRTTRKAKAEVETEEETGADNGQPLEERVAALITEAIVEAEGEVKSSKLLNLMLTSFPGTDNKADRAAASKLVQDAAFLGDKDMPWEFDADSRVLSIGD